MDNNIIDIIKMNNIKISEITVKLISKTIPEMDIKDMLLSSFPDKTKASLLDLLIVYSARQSTTANTKGEDQDRKLIKYLMKNKHTSPFECIDFSFLIEAPLFVIQHLLRHRTASINQFSARYSEMEDKFYIANYDEKTNKTIPEEVKKITIETYNKLYNLYKDMLSKGISREIARNVLPVSIFSRLTFKMNLHNIFHFLELRMDKHTQYETRIVANQIYEIIKKEVPWSCQAWESLKSLEGSMHSDVIDFKLNKI